MHHDSKKTFLRHLDEILEAKSLGEGCYMLCILTESNFHKIYVTSRTYKLQIQRFLHRIMLNFSDYYPRKRS